MAILARASITLVQTVDVDNVTWWYKLQASTAAWPSKPTTATPAGWTTTEPTYTEGSTNSLYTCVKTTYSDGTFEYSDVSLSTSYEAAKIAYQKSVNAIDTVNNMEIGGTNLATTHDAVSVPDGYGALYFYLTEPIVSEQTYTLTLWNVDISHTGKTESQLGINVYYCGGYVRFGGWQGTNYIVNGHADELSITFTPHLDRVADVTGGNITSTRNMSDSSVSDEVNKFICLYNSVPNAEGTRSLTVEKWKLEKGNKKTDWSPSAEDTEAASNSITQLTMEELEARINSDIDSVTESFQITIENITGGTSSSISDVIQEIADTSLIKLGKADIDVYGNLILRHNDETYMQLDPHALILVADGQPVASIANEGNIGRLIANNCEISTLRMRSESASRVGVLAWVARENGHLSLKEITN